MTMKTSLGVCRPERLALPHVLQSAWSSVFDVSEGGRDRDRLRGLWAAPIQLDLPMPRMRGLEIVRGLRSAGGDGPEAIIVSHGRIPDSSTAVRLGATEVLVRPLDVRGHSRCGRGDPPPAAGSREGPARATIFVAVESTIIDLLRAKQALDRREFDEAERLVRWAIDRHPDSAGGT